MLFYEETAVNHLPSFRAPISLVNIKFPKNGTRIGWLKSTRHGQQPTRQLPTVPLRQGQRKPEPDQGIKQVNSRTALRSGRFRFISQDHLLPPIVWLTA